MAKLREAKEAAEREIAEFRAQVEADFQRRLAEVRIRSIPLKDKVGIDQVQLYCTVIIASWQLALLVSSIPPTSVFKSLAFEFCLLFKLFFFFPVPSFILPISWSFVLMWLVEGWRLGLQFKIFPIPELKLQQHKGCKCFMNIVEWFSRNVLTTTLLCYETSPMHFACFFFFRFPSGVGLSTHEFLSSSGAVVNWIHTVSRASYIFLFHSWLRNKNKVG